MAKNNSYINQLGTKIDNLMSSIDKLVVAMENNLKNTSSNNNDGGNNNANDNSDKDKSDEKLTEEIIKLETKLENLKNATSLYSNNSEKLKDEISGLKKAIEKQKRINKDAINYGEDGSERYSKSKKILSEIENANDVKDKINSSVIGGTKLGNSLNKIISNGQVGNNFKLASSFLKTNSAQIGSAMFGTGKTVTFATQALGKLGTSFGTVGKLLGGPVVSGIMAVWEAAKFIADTVGKWKELNALDIDYQRQAEETEFNKNKEIYVINVEKQMEDMSFKKDMLMKELEVAGANKLEGLSIELQQYVNSIGVVTNQMFKGINETAADAAIKNIDFAASYKKYNLDVAQRETEQERYNTLRETQNKNKLSLLQENANVAETNAFAENRKNQAVYEQERVKKGGIMSFVNDSGTVRSDGIKNDDEVSSNEGNKDAITGKNTFIHKSSDDFGGNDNLKNSSNVARYAAGILSDGLVEGMNKEVNSHIDLANSKIKRDADAARLKVENSSKIIETQISSINEIENKKLGIVTETAKKITDATAEAMKLNIQFARNVEVALDKFTVETTKEAINLGFTNKEQVEKFQSNTFNAIEVVSKKFGKSYEEMLKYTNSYSDMTGRNKVFGVDDYSKITALGKYLDNDSLATNYSSEMEIFNKGVADSVDELDKVLQQVNKIGLNGRKFTRELVNNLKLAQKYNFIDGTRGLMEMSKWAQNTRFNMSSLGSMIDKVVDGGLEGIITQAAQFQVLGGHSAMNADPIAMMYEAVSDPQSYAKRMQDMTKGYGHFNRETGEMEYGYDEHHMIHQIAKIQGRSDAELRGEIMARYKKDDIRKLVGDKFDDDQLSYLTNNSSYDKATQSWKVKVAKNGGFVDENISNLASGDLESIIPVEHNEKMENYMERIVTAVEALKGEELAEQGTLMKNNISKYLEEYAERLNKAKETFEANLNGKDGFNDKIKKGMEAITTSFSLYAEQYEKGNEAISSEMTELNKITNGLNGYLSSLSQSIVNATNRINGVNSNEVKEAQNKTPNIQGKVQAQSVDNSGNNSNLKVTTDRLKKLQEMYEKNTGAGTSVKQRENYEKENAKLQKDFEDDFFKRPEISSLSKDKQKKLKEIYEKYGFSASYYQDNSTKGVLKELKNRAKGVFENLTTLDWFSDKDELNFLNGIKVNDGIVNNNGSPILSQASKVTKVHDGTSQIVQSDKADTALFAKDGGPFDVLFNGVFAKVNAIHDTFENILSNRNTSYKENENNGTNVIKFDTLKIELGGRLDLSSGGQSINIINELQNNPMLLRSLSRMLTEQVSSAMNGGRGLNNLSIGSV
nr:MAG TPA: hypothetical protein [Caudoviricetes sp.]